MTEARSQDWLLINLSINDIISYISTTNNQAQILVDIIVSVIINPLIVFALVVFSKRVFDFAVMARKLWVMSRINPDLEVEITLSGEIEPHIPKNFAPIMESTLRSIHNFPIIHDTGDVFKFNKRFADFDGNFRIIPIEEKTKYKNIIIIFATKGLKLKKLKRGIIELRNYLLGDLVRPLQRGIKFSPDTNNEEITIKFAEIPIMLQSIKELNINELTSEENHTRVTITRDKIKIVGNIEQSIDKIENIIKANLAS